MKSDLRSKLRLIVLALPVWLLGGAIFRRDIILGGFTHLDLPHGDGRLLTFLHEHWLQVVQGFAPWRSPIMFYPAEGTLGYSHSALLTSGFYMPLRWMGLQDLIAMQITWILMSLVGFLGFTFLARRIANAPVPIALVGATLFTYSNTMHAIRPQQHLTSLFLLPWVVLGFLYCARRLQDQPRRATTLAFLMGGLCALLFTTEVYISWFATLSACVFAALFLLHRRPGLRTLLDEILRPQLPVAIAAGTGFALGLIPFFLIYVPVLLEGHPRLWEEALASAGPWTDLFNPGRQNLLWGDLLARFPGYPTDRLNNPNLRLAPTPLVLLTAVVGGLAYARRRPRTAGAALTTSFLVLLVLPVRIGEFTLWRFVWTLVPGATAIRIVWRLEIVVTALAALLVTLVLVRLARQPGRAPRIAIVLLTPLLLVEQVSRDSWAHLDLDSERATLASVPSPPEGCVAFVMTDEIGIQPEPQKFALHLSSHLRMPTVNGYSRYWPKGWKLDAYQSTFVRPTRQLLDDAATWLLLRNALEGVCHLDLPTAQWDRDPFDDYWLLEPEATLFFGRDGNADRHLLGDSWSMAEDWGRWTEGEGAQLVFQLGRGFDRERPIDLEFEVGALVYGTHSDQTVRVEVDGQHVTDWKFTSFGKQSRVIRLSETFPHPEGMIRIAFNNLNPASPLAVGLNEDPRVLGLSVNSLRVTQPGDGPTADNNPAMPLAAASGPQNDPASGR